MTLFDSQPMKAKSSQSIMLVDRLTFFPPCHHLPKPHHPPICHRHHHHFILDPFVHERKWLIAFHLLPLRLAGGRGRWWKISISFGGYGEQARKHSLRACLSISPYCGVVACPCISNRIFCQLPVRNPFPCASPPHSNRTPPQTVARRRDGEKTPICCF